MRPLRIIQKPAKVRPIFRLHSLSLGCKMNTFITDERPSQQIKRNDCQLCFYYINIINTRFSKSFSPSRYNANDANNTRKNVRFCTFPIVVSVTPILSYTLKRKKENMVRFKLIWMRLIQTEEYDGRFLAVDTSFEGM